MRTREELLKVIKGWQSQLDKSGKLVARNKSNGILDIEAPNLKEFIRNYIVANNIEGKTSGTTTEADGHTQCRPGAKRSAGDIYQLALYYVKEKFTLLDVLRAIWKLCEEQDKTPFYKGQQGNYALFMSVCGTINRRVFYCSSWKEDSVSRYSFRLGNLNVRDGYDRYISAEPKITWDEHNLLFENEVIEEPKKVVKKPVVPKPAPKQPASLVREKTTVTTTRTPVKKVRRVLKVKSN